MLSQHKQYLLFPNHRKEREVSPESEYRTYNGSIGSRRSSVSGTAEPQHVAPDRVRFARDTSHYWYKPNISRDDGKLFEMPSVMGRLGKTG